MMILTNSQKLFYWDRNKLGIIGPLSLDKVHPEVKINLKNVI